MRQARRIVAFISLLNLCAGCAQIEALTGKKDDKAEAQAPAEPAHEGAHDDHDEPDGGARDEHEAPAAQAHGDEAAPPSFALPFAWESSDEEPLARARQFLRELASANDAHRKRDPASFEAYAEGEKPRATVLTCADSRLQASAIDATPENDLFTIRNLGNQLANAAGSVEYGVEQLHTPLLLIIGHTGCGAVKAAMGDKSKLSPAIQAELASLTVSEPKDDLSSGAAFTAAVDENVHAQVALALAKFAPEVASQDLTVVGAIYDFRNELGLGAGHLSVVNVNGIRERDRLEAFEAAIRGSAGSGSAPAIRRGLDPAAAKTALARVLEEARASHSGH